MGYGQDRTDYLLYKNTIRTAQNWTNCVAANFGDLDQIAAGEASSSARVTSFEAARKSGEVFRYTIFNRYGCSVLVSDRDKITPVDVSDFSAAAARSSKGD